MTHQRPRAQTSSIERQGAAEIIHGFFVLGEETVVISYYDACLRAEFVGCGTEMSEEGEFWAEVHDVEDVAVVV